MTEEVKGGLREARVAATEEKILQAATELFLQHGYAGTTLAAVAGRAEVGERTVYVRFGTKSALLKRALDVAFAGDTAPVDVRGREWFTAAETASALADRIAAMAGGVRHMMVRAGDLLAVALQAAEVEPDLAAAAQAGREATRDNMRAFLLALRDDGLLPPDADLEWLTGTVSLLVHAETHLLARRMHGWDPDEYEHWLTVTLNRLLSGTTGRS